MTETTLTKAQQRILDAVRRDGKRIYNGLATRPIERLEALGLVSADWDMLLLANGRTLWCITVTPREETKTDD